MLKMNDGKYFMFQGSVYDVLMWFGWDFNCNRIYFNFLIKIFLFVKMEKCYVVIEKKLVSCIFQIGYFVLYIIYKIFCSCQVQIIVFKYIFKNIEIVLCVKIFMVYECVILGVDRLYLLFLFFG